jgi:hypothetical protein
VFTAGCGGEGWEVEDAGEYDCVVGEGAEDVGETCTEGTKLCVGRGCDIRYDDDLKVDGGT